MYLSISPPGIEPGTVGILFQLQSTALPTELQREYGALAGNRTRCYCLEGNNVTSTPPGLIYHIKKGDTPSGARTRDIRVANDHTCKIRYIPTSSSIGKL